MRRSLADEVKDMMDPVRQDEIARLQNAQTAVSWAYKMAQEAIIGRAAAYTDREYVDALVTVTRLLKPNIEKDLNDTLEVLKKDDR